MNSPLQIGLNFGLDKGTISRMILGGEAALWSEQVKNYVYYYSNHPKSALQLLTSLQGGGVIIKKLKLCKEKNEKNLAFRILLHIILD